MTVSRQKIFFFLQLLPHVDSPRKQHHLSSLISTNILKGHSQIGLAICLSREDRENREKKATGASSTPPPPPPASIILLPTPQVSRIQQRKWTRYLDVLSDDEACRLSAMAVQSKKLDKTADANLPSSEHGQFLLVYSLLVMIRLHFALSNSYIHPDEHFQGPEVVVGKSPLT